MYTWKDLHEFFHVTQSVLQTTPKEQLQHSYQKQRTDSPAPMAANDSTKSPLTSENEIISVPKDKAQLFAKPLTSNSTFDAPIHDPTYVYSNRCSLQQAQHYLLL